MEYRLILRQALFIALEIGIALIAIVMIYNASFLATYPFMVYEIEGQQGNINQGELNSKEERYVVSGAVQGIEVKNGDRLIGISGRALRGINDVLLPLRQSKPRQSLSLSLERDTVIRFYSVSLMPDLLVKADSVNSTRIVNATINLKEKLNPFYLANLVILFCLLVAALFILNHQGVKVREVRKENNWQALWLFSLPIFLLLGAHFPSDRWEAMVYRITHLMIFPVLSLYLISRFRPLWNENSKKIYETIKSSKSGRLFPSEKGEKMAVRLSVVGVGLALVGEGVNWAIAAGVFVSGKELQGFVEIHKTIESLKEWTYPIWHFLWMAIFAGTVWQIIRELKSPKLRIRERDASARKAGFYLAAIAIPTVGYISSNLLPAALNFEFPAPVSRFLTLPHSAFLFTGSFILFWLAEMRFAEERINQITPQGIKRFSEAIALFLIGIGLFATFTILPQSSSYILLSVAVALGAAMLFQPFANGNKMLFERWFFQAQQNTRALFSEYETALLNGNSKKAIEEVLERYIAKAVGVEEAWLFGATNAQVLELKREPKLKEEHLSKLKCSSRLRLHHTRVPKGKIGIWLNQSVSTVKTGEWTKGNIGKGEIVVKALPSAFTQKEIGGALYFEGSFTESRKTELCVYFCVFKPKAQGALFYDEDVNNLAQMVLQFQTYDEKLLLSQEALLQAEESRRLNEIGSLKTKFLAGVSHDLKTPLASIKLFAELLKNGVSQEAQEKYLTIIEGESDRLSRLISSVLNYARLESREYASLFSLKPMKLSTAVAEVVSSMSYQFTLQNFTIRTSQGAEAKEPEPMIIGDEGLLKQVIENLLTNAIKYSSEKKEIDITLDWGSEVTLRIRDYGIGISESELPKIFDAYFRSESARNTGQGGFGIGLSFVKMVLMFHRADIECKSEVGKGSEFLLKFPLRTDENASL